jgi:hypothetical protein
MQFGLRFPVQLFGLLTIIALQTVVTLPKDTPGSGVLSIAVGSPLGLRGGGSYGYDGVHGDHREGG